MINTINSFCEDLEDRGRLGPGNLFLQRYPFDYDVDEWAPIEVVVSLEVSTDSYLRKPVDSCDTIGLNKKGSIVEDNCQRWRIDPNADL
ncbi:uncharacterized protein DNG_09776 [Cephalotrichum gorgonifer]|uniref:Uncharacterized protein n=1 Tax=Cephalotrichum gorgonifer TaxID=2041049 RepID=A0AAE8T0E3_9PEZI|nr:uncharacterized protein DNG_09776 [Cephalotrichum gorgonifer]